MCKGQVHSSGFPEEGIRVQSQGALGLILAASLTSCGTVGKSLNLSMPWFPPPMNGGDNEPQPSDRVVRLHE